jgi:regulator of protease activity HflC (stomatin/prohibitin superfamily)
MEVLTAALAVVVLYLFGSLRIIRQYERAVTFFLGRFWGTKGPGLIFIPAIFARTRSGSRSGSWRSTSPPGRHHPRQRLSQGERGALHAGDGPGQGRIEIEDYLYATSQLAQTTLRSVLGEVELDELLADREKINRILKRVIDERTDPGGSRSPPSR